jgi:hypothetical protein
MPDFERDEFDSDEIESIRDDVNRRFLRRGLLAGHGIIWLFVGTLILLLGHLRGQVIIAMIAGWFGLLCLHGLAVYVWEARDRAVKQAVQQRRGAREKVKRDDSSIYRLADDGELIEVKDQDATGSKRKRGNRV